MASQIPATRAVEELLTMKNGQGVRTAAGAIIDEVIGHK